MATNLERPNPIPPVLHKADMQQRLRAGEFGNTSPSWLDFAAWEAVAPPDALWGIRHVEIAGFPGCKLNVKTADVGSVIQQNFGGTGYQISKMTEGYVLWEGDISLDAIGPYGLTCRGHRRPANGSWRTHMKTPEVWSGVQAALLLREVLNANSHADLMELLEAYPDHVVEVSAMSRCFGTLPRRNGVVWEVRRY